MPTESANWEEITPEILKPSIKYLRVRLDEEEWKCAQNTKYLCYAALHPLMADEAVLATHMRGSFSYQLGVSENTEREVQRLLGIGTEPAIFAAYFYAYSHALLPYVHLLFNEVVQIALTNSDILNHNAVEWAKDVLETLINEKVNQVEEWIQYVCDEQDNSKPLDTAGVSEEPDLRKTWRAPRLIWMGPSGDWPYNSTTAWAREGAQTTELLLRDHAGRFLQLLGGALQGWAGDAHLSLAKEGWRPSQAPERKATEKVTKEVQVPQQMDTKEWEVPITDSELRNQQGQPVLGRSAAARVGRLAQQAQSEQRGRASENDALLLKYRSEVKRAILIQLTQNPVATDLEICRNLDADGSLELPQGWRAKPTDRGFFDAYSDAGRRHKVEAAISKVRQDLRRRGLLPSR